MTCPAKALGLVSFVVVAAITEDAIVRVVALLVLANGLLCHVHASAESILWDVACNVVLAIVVNCTTSWQPYTGLLTLVSLAAFAVSAGRPNTPRYDAMHVVFVQAYGALCLACWR
jgi:hypothetical protein